MRRCRRNGETRRNIYEFIIQFIDKNGYAPTLREISKEVGLASIGTTHRHVSNLRDEGLIDFQRYKGRTIVIK